MNRILMSLPPILILISAGAEAQPDAGTTRLPDTIASVQRTDGPTGAADSTETTSPSAVRQIDTAGYTIYNYDTHRNGYMITYKPKENVTTQPVSPLKSANTSVEQSYAPAAPQQALENKTTSTSTSISDYTKVTIQNQLKSAKQLASAGAAFYGIGLGLEVIGIIVLISEFTNLSNSYDPYNGYNEEPSFAGLYIALIGGVTSFGGTIAANMGGSRARIYYSTIHNNTPPFKGWQYFSASIACNVGATLLSQTEVPVVPSLLSLTGFIFGLSSIIHSCNYSSRLYAHSLVISDMNCIPIVDIAGTKSLGLVFSCDFGFVH